MPDRHQEIKALASKLQQRVSALGVAVIVVDDEGKAHVVPGWTAEVIGVYAKGVTLADLAEDLAHAKVRTG